MLPPQDNIYPVLDKHLPPLANGDILVITSKVLAIHQGRSVKILKDSPQEKNALIMQEADRYIPPRRRPGQHWHLTMKDNTLIADAGIDKSNSNGYYILWPKNTKKLAKEIWQYLRKKHRIKDLGIIVVDSHLIPLRSGTVGISTASWGIVPRNDYRGLPDIFGRKLKYTKANVLDALAAPSVFLMGESSECTPLLVIRDTPNVQFTERDMSKIFLIDPEIDIYEPILKVYKKNPRKK